MIIIINSMYQHRFIQQYAEVRLIKKLTGLISFCFLPIEKPKFIPNPELNLISNSYHVTLALASTCQP